MRKHIEAIVRDQRMGHFMQAAGCAIALATGCGEGVDSLDEGDEALGQQEQALSQNCGDILAQGVFDELVATRSSSDRFALTKAFCKELKSSGGGGGSIGVDVFKIVGVELSGSGESSSYSKYCEYFSEAQDSAETTSLMTRTVNANVVNAWAQCMTRTGGLACYARPGDNVVGVTYEELANSGELKGVSVTTSNMTIGNRADAVPTLYIGDTGLAYTIPDATKDSTMTLNGRTANTNFNQTCSVRIKANSAVNVEIAAAAARLASTYRTYHTAIQGIPSSEGKAIAMLRDRELAAINQRITALTKVKTDCNAGGPCLVPTSDHFSYTAKSIGVRCKGGSTLPSVQFSRNTLSTTPAEAVAAIRRSGKASQNWLGWGCQYF